MPDPYSDRGKKVQTLPVQIAELESALEQGSQLLGIELDSEQREKLLHYLALIAKWNKTYNLTAITDPAKMLSSHLLDSLAVASYIRGERLLDVGTGAGLPGIPLAILQPERTLELLDSNGKKTRFLVQVVSELRLDNVEIWHRRVEQFEPTELFDGVISRAFASLKDMTDNAGHLLDSRGSFWAMKGKRPEEEILALASNWKVVDIQQLRVPFLDGERHLIEITDDHHRKQNS